MSPLSALANTSMSTARWVRFLAEPRTRRDAEEQLSVTRRTAQRHLADLVSLRLALRGADHRYRLTDPGQALLVRLGGDTRLSPPSELGTTGGDTGMSPLESRHQQVGSARRFLLVLDSPKTRAELEAELAANRRTVQRNVRRLADLGLVHDDARVYRRVTGWEGLLDQPTGTPRSEPAAVPEEPRLPEHVAEQAVSVEDRVPASTLDRLRELAARNEALKPRPRFAPQPQVVLVPLAAQERQEPVNGPHRAEAELEPTTARTAQQDRHQEAREREEADWLAYRAARQAERAQDPQEPTITRAERARQREEGILVRQKRQEKRRAVEKAKTMEKRAEIERIAQERGVTPEVARRMWDQEQMRHAGERQSLAWCRRAG